MTGVQTCALPICTADPLDQRSSVGWKGVHAAAILYDEYMVRVECGSSYSGEDKAN